MHRLASVLVSGANFLRRHRTACLVALSVFLIFGAYGIGSDFAWANTPVNARNAGWVDDLLITLAQMLNSLAQFVGKMTLVLIGALLIPILNYDGFSQSRIVGIGWSLVRDVVNMFVIVVLLIIAVQTILGLERANWQQQIPRLFIFTILVNFSRTICGLGIDISNVVMFQFVNALLDIGAGNFANLLKLNIVGDFADGIDSTKAWQLFGAAYLQLSLMLAVLAVMAILVIVYLYRIVVLWVLIILSPAAFFMGGAKKVLSSGAFDEWLKKFIAAAVLGPMLTFFVWLALAAASAGDIMESEDFPEVTTDSVTGVLDTGLLLEMFDMSQLTGLLLGLVFIIVGLQQAGKSASALGGVAAKLVNEGVGYGIVTGALTAPAATAWWAGKTAGREGLRQVDRRGLGLADKMTGKNWAGKYHSVGGMLGAGAIAAGGKLGAAGQPLRALGSGIQNLSHASTHHAEEKAKKAVEGMSEDRLASELELAAAGKGGTLLSNQDMQHFAMRRLVTDKDFQKKLKFKVGDKKFEEMMRGAIATVEHHESEIIGNDDAAGKAFNATKTRYVHLLGEMEGADGKMVDAGTRQRAHLDSPKTDLRDLSGDALRNEGVRAHLDSLTRFDEDGREISKLEDVKAGRFGDDARKAALDAPKASLTAAEARFTDEKKRRDTLRDLTVAAITVDADQQKNKDRLRDAITSGSLPLESITAEELTSDNFLRENNRVAIVQAMASSGRDLRVMNKEAKDATVEVLTKIIESDTTPSRDRRHAIAARYQITGDVGTLNFTGQNAGSNVAAFAQVVRRDPTVLQGISDEVLENRPEVRSAVERSVNSRMIAQLQEKYANSEGDERKKIAATLRKVHTALDREVQSAGNNASNELKNKRRRAAAAVSELDQDPRSGGSSGASGGSAGPTGRSAGAARPAPAVPTAGDLGLDDDDDTGGSGGAPSGGTAGGGAADPGAGGSNPDDDDDPFAGGFPVR